MEKINEKLLSILSDMIPGEDITEETALIEDGILDSLDIVSLVGEIYMEFDVKIGVEDLVPENFNSVSEIARLISRLANL